MLRRRLDRLLVRDHRCSWALVFQQGLDAFQHQGAAALHASQLALVGRGAAGHLADAALQLGHMCSELADLLRELLQVCRAHRVCTGPGLRCSVVLARVWQAGGLCQVRVVGVLRSGRWLGCRLPVCGMLLQLQLQLLLGLCAVKGQRRGVGLTPCVPLLGVQEVVGWAWVAGLPGGKCSMHAISQGQLAWRLEPWAGLAALMPVRAARAIAAALRAAVPALGAGKAWDLPAAGQLEALPAGEASAGLEQALAGILACRPAEALPGWWCWGSMPGGPQAAWTSPLLVAIVHVYAWVRPARCEHQQCQDKAVLLSCSAALYEYPSGSRPWRSAAQQTAL